jgi:hypothetical protein
LPDQFAFVPRLAGGALLLKAEHVGLRSFARSLDNCCSRGGNTAKSRPSSDMISCGFQLRVLTLNGRSQSGVHA